MTLSKVVRHRFLAPGSVAFITDPDRPYMAKDPTSPTQERIPTAFFCPACRIGHVYKTYHIPLDANGEARLSEGVFNALVGLGAIDGGTMRPWLTDAGLSPAQTPFEFVSDEIDGPPVTIGGDAGVSDEEGRDLRVGNKPRFIVMDHPTELERMGVGALPPRTREGNLRNG